jgi:hypothetical protein
MSDKVLCKECSVKILPSTADRTGGMCMPCKNGYRKNIEQAKEYYKKERELIKCAHIEHYGVDSSIKSISK